MLRKLLSAWKLRHQEETICSCINEIYIVFSITVSLRKRNYIWKVSLQLSCGNSCRIWMWFNECYSYFYIIQNFAYDAINERSFRNPHPLFSSVQILWDLGSHRLNKETIDTNRKFPIYTNPVNALTIRISADSIVYNLVFVYVWCGTSNGNILIWTLCDRI